MACNDDVARTLADICHMDHIQVPDQIAILGVDNDEHLCLSASPPLSSIALATERAGYETAALLMRLIVNPEMRPENVVVQSTHVITRQSTDVLTLEDPNIARALRFIRTNASRGIQVPELARIAGLSKRVMQDRFREYLKRTPLEEIHRCRAAHMAKLLIETNLTVSEIAEASGFSFDSHFARFFSKHSGMTPLAYRRTHRTS
jgi:LacI family transcriptional regulator